jgi:hypothetical protein
VSDGGNVLQRIFQYESKDNRTEAVLQVRVWHGVKNHTMYEKLAIWSARRLIFMNSVNWTKLLRDRLIVSGIRAGYYNDKDELPRFYNDSSREYYLLKGNFNVILI